VFQTAGKTIHEDADIRLWTLDDEVLIASIKSKMHAIGPGVTDRKIGDRVGTLPYFYWNRGVSGDQAIVDARYLAPTPEGLSASEGASIWMQFLTAYYPLVEITPVGPGSVALVTAGTAKKGDVLGIARLAGIMGAKKTADLIPLCHPLPITKVALELVPDAALPGVRITATVKTTGQTGVEMEALTAVSVAALTVHDMLKAVEKSIEIGGIRVVLKDGGKSGRYEAKG
jgi:cyclic pyranopterin phosphate synthase